MSKDWKTTRLPEIVDEIVGTFADGRGINQMDDESEINLPTRKKTIDVLEKLFMVIFPGYTTTEPVSKSNIPYHIGNLVNTIYHDLLIQITRCFKFHCHMKNCRDCNCEEMAKKATIHLIERLPWLRETAKLDVYAAYKGDPAAKSFDEIITSYPAVEAVTTYRIAHELYLKDVPLIPRIMTEYAHSRTGVDLHPGATIGKSFFIDHCTGVVIGETTIIGNNIKIYQGVTLGALSFKIDKTGEVIREEKRHPTIEDNVVIYAGATILGGTTNIGKNSTIGGNVWLTESVPPGSKVFINKPDLVIKTKSDSDSKSKK